MSKNYDMQISHRLDDLFLNTSKKTMQKEKLKLIIFSDLHKGQKDLADDFRFCKSAYHAALAYYYHLGFTIILVGDLEELWECRPKKVVRAYADTLALEERFAKDNRYLRIWGNHDDYWSEPKAVSNLLGKHVMESGVQQSMRIIIMADDKCLGEIFLTHGHQGTTSSDKFAWISKPFVRHVWRNFQRITGIKSTTPAKDFKLRKTHELAMHRWANTKKKLLLIAGHTHHPVFMSQSNEDVILKELSLKQRELKISLDSKERPLLDQEIAELYSQLEWVKSKYDDVEINFGRESKPCYFNTGCCSFADGDITGIEIERNEIRLVRWPNDDGAPKKKVLSKALIEDVFNRC